MPQKTLEISTPRGTLRGMAYLPDTARRSPGVLFLHGFTGQRTESGFLYVRLARRLLMQGIASVTFDFCHSGESDGQFDQMLVTGELDDTLLITRWMLAQPFVDRTRLGLLGFSLGGLLAACAAARMEVYKAITLLAPTTVDNLCRYATSQQALSGGMVTIGAHVLHPDFFDDLRTLNPVSDLLVHPRPTLLIQGTADKSVPPTVSQVFVDALAKAGVTHRQHLIQDAGHTFASPSMQNELIETTADWFGRYL